MNSPDLIALLIVLALPCVPVLALLASYLVLKWALSVESQSQRPVASQERALPPTLLSQADHQTVGLGYVIDTLTPAAWVEPTTFLLPDPPLSDPPTKDAAAEVLIIGPAAPILIGPSENLTIGPAQRAVWDERGWTVQADLDRTTYQGQYQIFDHQQRIPRRFSGWVKETTWDVVAYIADPPPELRHHPKSVCFTPDQLPWFRVNWYIPATNVDEAILYVEKVLDEAINR
jgi:hypothetical protein